MDEKKISFGLANITIGEGSDQIKFDGKDYLQVEGGEVTLTPNISDINFADFGEVAVKKYVTGYTGEVTISAGQESIELLELALGAVKTITDTQSSEVVGVTDAKVGTELKGRKVVIHPRVLPEEIKDYDITIYNMASTGGLTKSFNAEQNSYQITLEMLPRDGFDPSKDSNFYYTGPVDPNA